MEGSGPIERNRMALVRIVASLVAMAGLAVGPDPEAQAEASLPVNGGEAARRLTTPRMFRPDASSRRPAGASRNLRRRSCRC
jgi:hypothetical protein